MSAPAVGPVAAVERVVSPLAHFGRCPESLLFSDATPHECTLYAALTTYDYGRTGECYPGRELLAERLGWTVRTVDRAFQNLVARGAIERRRRGRGNPNLIVLLADVLESPDMATQPMSRQNGADESPDREISPLIERERTREAARSKKKRLLPTDDWEPSEKTKEWCRREYPEYAKRSTLEAFRNHHLANGSRFVDWDRAFQTWVSRQPSFDPKRSNGAERGPSRTYL